MNKKVFLIVFAIFIVLVILVVFNLKNRASLVSDIKDKHTVSGLVSEARQLESKNNLIEVKKIYKRLVQEFPNASEVMQWQKKIESINIKLLFSPTITPKSTSYVIKQGDSLYKIASKFHTTVELIKKSNNLTSDKILPGKSIKVWTAPFSVFIDKSQNILMLKTDEEIIKTYTVATGKNNSTPTGNFKIVNKLVNPTWFKSGAVIAPDSPENILGTRWLGFNITGYGIHGTTEPQSLGQQVTEGCVRMANPDIEELFSILPVGTEVTVVD